MATVPHKAFYCTYHGLSGVLTAPLIGCSSWSPTAAPWSPCQTSRCTAMS